MMIQMRRIHLVSVPRPVTFYSFAMQLVLVANDPVDSPLVVTLTLLGIGPPSVPPLALP